MFPPGIKKLIEIFTSFPGIGPRQATRFVFYLLKRPQEELEALAEKLKNLKQQFHYCPECMIVTDNSDKLCVICRSSQRDKEKICIVEKDSDIENIENAHTYDGLYFILGNTDITKESSNSRINNLVKRIRDDSGIGEVIIATSPTTTGDAAALFIEKNLKSLGKKITRLGRGLPSGGEIEYADEITLGNAFKNRG